MRCLARMGAAGWLAVAGLLAGGCAPAEPVQVTPASLPNGAVGIAYGQGLSASGVSSPVWQVVAGGLPPGLGLDPATGSLDGTPSEAGTFAFTVAVSARGWPARLAEVSYNLTIVPKLAVEADPPAARVGLAYSYAIPVSGGVPPYQWTLVGLPAGLRLDEAAGAILGTPVVATNDIRLELTVTDAGPPTQRVVATLQLDIKPAAVRIVTSTLPPGQVNEAYSAELEAADGMPPYEWTITSGILPDGLRLNRQTGVISGTPWTAGAWPFDALVTDADSPATTDLGSFSIVIEP